MSHSGFVRTLDRSGPSGYISERDPRADPRKIRLFPRSCASSRRDLSTRCRTRCDCLCLRLHPPGRSWATSIRRKSRRLSKPRASPTRGGALRGQHSATSTDRARQPRSYRKSHTFGRLHQLCTRFRLATPRDEWRIPTDVGRARRSRRSHSIRGRCRRASSELQRGNRRDHLALNLIHP